MTNEQRIEFIHALSTRQLFNNPSKRMLARLLWEDYILLLEQNRDLRDQLHQQHTGGPSNAANI